MKLHHYRTMIRWTGNRGNGTADYRAYERTHVIAIDGKADIMGSSDAAFRGDPAMHTPEDMLVASLAACHMLWYLHLCATHGVVVSDYRDRATGIMEENEDGSGQFTTVTLHPEVTVADPGMLERAHSLHREANAKCFIARSVNFEVRHQPQVSVAAIY